MKHFADFFFIFVSTLVFAQAKEEGSLIKGVIKDDNSGILLSGINVINVNTVKGVVTDDKGEFSLMAFANDTLHISLLGYKSIKVKVTNDWIKNKTTTIQMTEKAYALEEVVVRPYILTGYLEIDAKLIPTRENYRYSISGLPEGYEAGEYSPNAFGRVLGSIFNPADMLYNFFGKKPKELRRLKEMKKDDTVKNLLASKFDRETISALLGVTKSEIAEILERCNYSEAFVKSANDCKLWMPLVLVMKNIKF